MSEYKFNSSDVNSGLITKGDYEATLERIERKVLPSGREKLSLMFRIRNDVEGQKFGNKCMFEDIWEEKNNKGIFNQKRINQLLGTQEIEDGTEFESINDVINFIKGSNLIIHIDVTFDEYHGEDVNTVSWYRSSKVKPQVLGDTESKVETIQQDDLPF